MTKRQKRIIKLAHRCGIIGFADPYGQGEYPELPNLSEDEIDDFEDYLRDFAALQESLRSLN